MERFGSIDNLEQDRKDEEDYQTALQAHTILDHVVAEFRPTGDVKKDVRLLQDKLEDGGINFSRLGNRSLRKTEEFIGKILRLTVSEMDRAEHDYHMDTINAMEELSDEVLAKAEFKDVVRRAA